MKMPKPVRWVGHSKEVLSAFPSGVKRAVGLALYFAQMGDKHPSAKPMKGFGSGVIEVIEDHVGDTYRAVYTVRWASAVYVLHAFQKKSRHGVATPKHDLDLIRLRLRMAQAMHARMLQSGGSS